MNVVAGASHVGLRDFLLGTLLGVLPGVLAIVLLEASLEWLVADPGLDTLSTSVLVAGGAVAAIALLRRLLPGSR